LSPDPAAKIPPAESSNVDGGDSPADHSSKRAVLLAALILAGLWIVGLVVLAAISANPVTINQMQIRDSDLIVTARRGAEGSSTLVITKEWIHGEELETITVTNLERTNIVPGEEFLVPLKRMAKGRFQVTPTSPALKEVPLIYPATPESKSQLQSLLESRAE
jgi:hypothetical protein